MRVGEIKASRASQEPCRACECTHGTVEDSLSLIPHDAVSTTCRLSQPKDLLGYLERIAFAVESWIPPITPSHRRASSGEALVPGLVNEDRAAIKRLSTDMTDIKTELAQIKELLTAQKGEVVKEAYTVEEVAKKTGYKPFTIRQACNKERIKGAYKGRDRAWRIPHASLLDILTNGIPSEQGADV